MLTRREIAIYLHNLRKSFYIANNMKNPYGDDLSQIDFEEADKMIEVIMTPTKLKEVLPYEEKK